MDPTSNQQHQGGLPLSTGEMNNLTNENGNPNSAMNGASKTLNIRKLPREDVMRLIETLEKMKNQGVDPNDQRFKTLVTILRAQGLHYNFNAGGVSPAQGSNMSGMVNPNSGLIGSGNISVQPNNNLVGPGGSSIPNASIQGSNPNTNMFSMQQTTNQPRTGLNPNPPNVNASPPNSTGMGSLMSNLVNPNSLSTSSNPLHTVNDANSLSNLTGQLTGGNLGVPPKGNYKVGSSGITAYQLFQLRAQILAYKYLSRNMALPAKLLTAIRTFSMRALQQQQQQMGNQMNSNAVQMGTGTGSNMMPQQGNPNMTPHQMQQFQLQQMQNNLLGPNAAALGKQTPQGMGNKPGFPPNLPQGSMPPNVPGSATMMKPANMSGPTATNPMSGQLGQPHPGGSNVFSSINLSGLGSSPGMVGSTGSGNNPGNLTNATGSNIATVGQSSSLNTGAGPTATTNGDVDLQVIQAIGGKPDSLSLSFVVQEREKRIKSRMAHRMEELAALSAGLSAELKKRALVELKQLKLIELQKRVRSDIVTRLRRTIEMEAAAADASAYRRNRKPTAKDQFKLDTLLPKSDNEVVRRQKHQEFLASVLKHVKDFKEFHLMKQKKMKRTQKDVINYHVNELRKQQLEEERRKRARLEALKNEDEDGYRKYLDEAKNERLSTLLKQTDQYLERIGAMLQSEKDRDEIEEKKKKKKKVEGESGQEVGGEPEGGEKEVGETGSEEAKAEDGETATEKNKKYYTMAHRIQEQITEQPEMIVGGKLKSYQLTGLQWLVSLYNNKLNGILADEMGLGKTIQTIALVAHLMEKKGDNGPYLVVVPLSTMSNWVMEFHKWATAIHVVVYKGKPQVRKQIYREEIMGGMFNVVISSYEYVMLDKADLGKIDWNYIIVDEGHRIKNKNSKLSTILRQYASRHRLLLTGTPLQNDLGELWSLLNFLLPNIFNSSKNFEQWFNAPFAFAQKKGKSYDAHQIAPNEEETLLIINRLHKVLRPFLLRRLKHEVESELPDKVETVLKCELSALQKRMYKHMVERGVLLTDPNAKGKTKKGFNNTLMQLQKICNHPYLFRDDWLVNTDLIRASGKFDLIDRILPKLRAGGHRILIFNQMTHIMDILGEYFAWRGWEFLRLDGSTKSEDRANLVKLWNTPNSPYWLFVLSTKAGGLGLNLQTADTVIIFDTDWNPQADLQAQDRAHRIGQKHEVRVFRLVSQNSVEEKILERATFKLDVDAKVIQAGMFNTSANDKMRKAMLESLLHDDTDDREIELVTSDEQVNSSIARSEEEYNMFQEMDQERITKELDEWRKSGHNGPPPPRLMQDEELPDYLKVDLKSIDEDITETYGRGRRERPEVVYDDGLTDDQFGRMLEGETIKKRKRGEKEEKSSRKGSEYDSDSHSSSSSGRKSRSHGEKTVLSPFQRKLQAIWNRVVEATTPDGRPLSPIFMKLPSKRDYPDYYTIIARPIALRQISQNIRSYRNLQEFKDDFVTMFSNARQYNVEGSFVYNDANALQIIFDAEVAKYFTETGAMKEDPANSSSLNASHDSKDIFTKAVMEEDLLSDESNDSSTSSSSRRKSNASMNSRPKEIFGDSDEDDDDGSSSSDDDLFEDEEEDRYGSGRLGNKRNTETKILDIDS